MKTHLEGEDGVRSHWKHLGLPQIFRKYQIFVFVSDSPRLQVRSLLTGDQGPREPVMSHSRAGWAVFSSLSMSIVMKTPILPSHCVYSGERLCTPTKPSLLLSPRSSPTSSTPSPALINLNRSWLSSTSTLNWWQLFSPSSTGVQQVYLDVRSPTSRKSCKCSTFSYQED